MKALLALMLAPVVAFSVGSGTARAGALYLNACAYFGDPGTAFQQLSSAGFGPSNRCPQGGSFQINPAQNPKNGENAQWRTITPPSIEIVHASTPAGEVLVDPNLGGDGYRAGFFWNHGTQSILPVRNCCGGMDYGTGINRQLGPSRYFGWQITCKSSPCGVPLQILDVRGIQLQAVDDTPPSVVPLGQNNLWYQAGRWVRGNGWPISFQASDDSGVCGMQAQLDGQSIPGPTDSAPNQHSWTQCPSPLTMSQTIDTTSYADGPLSIALVGRDAANPANVASPAQTLHVDNRPVSLSLSGPTDAPSTAGTQFVTARAAAGPSLVSGIACSVDGSPYQWHPEANAQIPVQGIGQHQVVCYALNRAIDSSGQPASSPTAMWTLSIRQPTAISASFAHLADAPQCARRTERRLIPGRWVKVRSRGRLVLAHRRPHVRRLIVVRCHARLIRRRARVHGHWRTVHVVVFPHVVNKTSQRIRFGARTTVSGWLGIGDGTALGGQAVRILAAPDDGSDRFAQVAIVSTAADGSWRASLPPGCSRLVEAVYDGSATTEPTASPDVRVSVPAKIRLRVQPQRVSWGARIAISGRLLGGHIPTNKAVVSQLLRLRIGVDGVSGTIGIPAVQRDGRFHTSFRFNPGRGIVRYWFTVSSLIETDYPFAPASSPRISVTVGPG